MKQTQVLSCNQPIVGRRISLRRLGAEHADLLLDSFSNDCFWNAYRANQLRNISHARLAEQLDFEHERVPAQVGKIEWLIERITDDCGSGSQAVANVHPIGLAGLSAFDSSKRQAEFMIGFFDSNNIVTGLGLEASLLVLSYAFNEASLNNLVSYVYAKNEPAQSNTLALGFTKKKFLKSHLRVANTESYYDVFQNELLAEDFHRNERLSRLSNRLLGIDVTSPQNSKVRSKSPPENTAGLSASFTLHR